MEPLTMRRILRQWLMGKPRPPTETIRKILVIRRNGIGDMVCALPLIRALKKAWPASSLTVLADRENAAIARCCEAVDQVLVFPLRRRLLRGRSWEIWRTARELRRYRFDLAVGVSGSFSRILGRLIYGTGAPRRVGTISPERAPDPFYYTHCRIRPNGSRTHQIVTGVELTQATGVECDPDAIQLELPPEEISGARRWLHATLEPSRPMVWLHLSNNRPKSRWNPASFRRLADRILRETEASLVIGRLKGDPLADLQPFEDFPHDRCVCFENALVTRFAAALSQSRVAVCGDGGVMHLAAALGVRTVALFSATEPEIWRPWGPDHIVLHRGDDVNLISVDEVFEAVRRSLHSSRLTQDS